MHYLVYTIDQYTASCRQKLHATGMSCRFYILITERKNQVRGIGILSFNNDFVLVLLMCLSSS